MTARAPGRPTADRAKTIERNNEIARLVKVERVSHAEVAKRFGLQPSTINWILRYHGQEQPSQKTAAVRSSEMTEADDERLQDMVAGNPRLGLTGIAAMLGKPYSAVREAMDRLGLNRVPT